MYWPWNLGPRNYIWATWVQKTYPTIGTEPWLQYWQTTPHCKSIMAAQKWQLNLLAEFLLHIFECLLTQNPTNQGSQLSRFFHNIWTTIRKSNRKGSYGIIFAGKWFWNLLHNKFFKKTLGFWTPGNQPKTWNSGLIFFSHALLHMNLT